MNDVEKMSAGAMMVWFILCIAMLYGYIANIVKFCHADFVMSAEEPIRFAGFFIPPVGGVVGYMDFERQLPEPANAETPKTETTTN